MIADISLPPFTTILMIVGALLIVLGLSGQITIKEATVGIPQKGLRVLAGIIGVGFICIAVWLFYTPNRTSNSSNSLTATPSSTPSPTLRTIPVEDYKKLIGKWSVTEKVRPEYGGYEIIWSYDATVIGNQLTMQGKKTFVREPGQNSQRELTEDEKATTSICTVILAGLQGEGTFEETNPHETIRGDVKIRFAENLLSFNGTAGEDVSTIIGSKQ